MKLDLNGVKLAIKTTYAARRSETPLMTMTKGGCVSFNIAFIKEFYPKTTKFYIQAASVKGVDYLLVSKKKLNNYYSVTIKPDNGCAITKIQGFITAFGKKGIAMRYTTTLVETSDPNIKAFSLKNVAEDLFTSKESANFEVAA
jgi:hypothetical protein